MYVRRIALLTSTLGLLLIGCGEGGDPTPGDSDPSPEDTPTPTSSPSPSPGPESPTPTDTTPALIDNDGDGYDASEDCDDDAPQVNPGETEVCDGVDNNCDGISDENFTPTTWYLDQDEDGYGADGEDTTNCDPPSNAVTIGGDCDDTNPSTNPEAVEVCDLADNNCDGWVDEGLATRHFMDDDADGYGQSNTAFLVPCQDVPPTGSSLWRGDCDDDDSSVYPGADDLEGGADADCGGTEGPDPHVGLSESSRDSLEAAFTAATDGNTLWVGEGTWEATHLPFNGKAIQLRSVAGASSTILDAGAQGPVAEITQGEGSDTLIEGFTLQQGINQQEGGCLRVSDASPTLRDLVVQDCQAPSAQSAGGGIFLLNSSSLLEDILLQRNEAQYGAGMQVDSSTVTIRRLEAADNLATGGGGGMGIYESILTLEDAYLHGNEALEQGGGLLILVRTEATITQLRAIENLALEGAGLYVGYESVLTLQHGLIENNTASTVGGGISLDGSEAAVSGCILEGNYASRGGGISITGGDLTITQSNLLGNVAGTAGGGIYFASGAVKITASLTNSLLAWNGAYNLFNENEELTLEVLFCDLYQNTGDDNHNLEDLSGYNYEVAPGLTQYAVNGRQYDLHLAIDSPLIDGGDADILDPDGSRSDIGYYGGPAASSHDLDGDGVPDWFWPGSLEAPPAGFSAEDFDENDQDPARQ